MSWQSQTVRSVGSQPPRTEEIAVHMDALERAIVEFLDTQHDVSGGLNAAVMQLSHEDAAAFGVLIIVGPYETPVLLGNTVGAIEDVLGQLKEGEEDG